MKPFNHIAAFLVELADDRLGWVLEIRERASLRASSVVWSATMETGDLSQWRLGAGTYRPEQDSGACSRPPSGVSSEQAYSGTYSMKMTIDTSAGKAGCRQHRNVEAISGNTYYYSAWFFISRSHVPNTGMWNILQYKSKSPTVDSIGSDPFWTMDITERGSGGPLHLVLKWKGGYTDHTAGVSGPFATSGTGQDRFDQAVADVPIGRWFKLEAYLKQSGQFDGRLTVWQDGGLLWDMVNVRTKYPDGTQQ